MLTLWRIFWRTFCQLMAAVMVAALAMDWTTAGNQFALNTDKLGAMSIMAVIGGVIAVLWSWAGSVATTALQKGLRSGAQALAGGLATLVVNNVSDIVEMDTLFVPLAAAVVGAFLLTYFSYQEKPEPIG